MTCFTGLQSFGSSLLWLVWCLSLVHVFVLQLNVCSSVILWPKKNWEGQMDWQFWCQTFLGEYEKLRVTFNINIVICDMWISIISIKKFRHFTYILFFFSFQSHFTSTHWYNLCSISFWVDYVHWVSSRLQSHVCDFWWNFAYNGSANSMFAY